jgi:hypothetical protein
MRPLLAIDKLALLGFVIILIVIGVRPLIIAPIVEAGVAPVVQRLDAVQDAGTVWQTIQTTAQNLISWLGGA